MELNNQNFNKNIVCLDIYDNLLCLHGMGTRKLV
ncbi:uncharacterized protein METZ01_LOCUS46054 [marine metagenome]|uniref:Uncharacterized protein n=1 Tax=marine metagenome TaxID=408172 RepID=A0A381RMU9_9ZZZZ